MLPNVLEMAHTLVASHVRVGDTVIDATAGNGWDTVFLAGLVGPSGTVFAFDTQEEALQASTRRLTQEKLLERVKFVRSGHETMDEFVHPAYNVRAVMFNLGFLPGSDKQVMTSARTSCPAILAALSLLAPGGVLTIVAYTGHAAGREELSAVRELAVGLDKRIFQVIEYTSINQHKFPPHLIAVCKWDDQ